MILSMSGQASLFLMAALIGVFAGLAYDFFRLLRVIFRHSDIVTHIEDILYWLFVSGAVLYIFLNENYGEVRAFCILGMFLGMLLYFLTLSRLVLAVSKAAAKLLYNVFRVVFSVLTFPAKLFYDILEKPIVYVKKMLKNFYRLLKKVLHNFKIYVKMKSRRTIGDILTIMKKV